MADGILDINGLDSSKHFIGFTVRPWKGFQRKASVFAAAADYAWEKYGLTPVFIPIEARLDLNAAQQVTSLLKSAPAHILPKCTSSAHTIGLFAKMDVVVSMRLHALVFSAGQGVPLVGVVYDQKVSSFLDSIGQDLYTQLNDLTVETLCSQIDTAVSRIGNTELLEAGVKRVRDAERHNITEAARLLQTGDELL